ncbi:MAG TPA: transketolase C-terminal domain-containing protein [Pseudobdellovibrionaceae bacterium]|nr:transketolase C-terminal domain-containing protein [Pseudobdellovibrionaceae bacterium]
MQNTLKIKNHLLGNPQVKPTFSLNLELTKEQILSVSDPRALRGLIALMDMYAVLGGAASHYGGPASLAEINSALYALVFEEAQNKKLPWNELYHLINDAGHCENGLYALRANYKWGLDLADLKKFRSLESPLTGHGEAHCFPEGVLLSNGPLGSAFPQSQGLALGEKLSGKNRVTICTVSDGASMEGEAKEAFAAIPGLAQKNLLGPYIAIINDNNTKLSGRIDKDCFSMSPTFESLSALGWEVLSLENGNRLQDCYLQIQKAIQLAKENPLKPIAIHAKTVKGIGTKATESSSSGGHGFPVKSPKELAAFISEIYNGEKYPELFNEWIQELLEIEKKQGPAQPGEKIQAGVSKALIRAKKEGLPLISVTSDLPGSTGLANFRKEFPESSIDVGIAESNMISTAAGLSKCGFIPVVDTFAQFGVTKGALPLTMASLSEAPLVGIFSHTGFQDAADGASHQALSYMAMTSSIPHVKVYNLSCADEAEALVYQALKEFAQGVEAGKTPPTSLFFLGRENFPKSYQAEAKYEAKYDLRKAQVILDNTAKFSKKVCILSCGSLIPQALLASQNLELQSVGSVILNVPGLTDLDVESLKATLLKCNGLVITVEDHQIIGGFGQRISHELSLNGISFKIKSLGVRGAFGRSAYNAIDLYKQHFMDAEAIAKSAQELLLST